MAIGMGGCDEPLKPPRVEDTLRKAREEGGLSFGYAGIQTPREWAGKSVAEVGYYVTWVRKGEKTVVRYLLFPFDKVLVVHEVSRKCVNEVEERSEKLEILPAYGTWLPSSEVGKGKC